MSNSIITDDQTCVNLTADPRMNEVCARPQRILAELFDRYPDWAEHYDDTDPFSASREELQDLLEGAPTDAAAMLIFGFIDARVQMAAMTGRPFV